MQKKLEKETNGMSGEEKSKVSREIRYHEKMIHIWQNNEEKLRKQMKSTER